MSTTEPTASASNEGTGEKQRKNKGASNAGRDRRSILLVMRSRAYIYALIRRTGVRSVNALKDTVFPLSNPLKGVQRGSVEAQPELDKCMRGERGVSVAVLNLVSQTPDLATARLVFEIGPEEDGDNVPLWAIFEDRFDEFDNIIESGLGRSDFGLNRMDRVAHLFLLSEQWSKLRTSSDVAAGSNLAQEAYDANKDNFMPQVRRLAAAIACWRLCLQGADEWGPMETLLDWLLIGPYKQLLADLGISAEMRDLLRMIAADHHTRQGNASAAVRALTRFGSDGNRTDPFG